MGWLRKKIKQLGRGIKKIGKKIGKAFKSVLKPFAKFFNKLGPLGSIAMMMILPGLGTAIAGWGAALGPGIGTAIQFVGNAINFVATAPQRVFGTITNALGTGWNALTTATGAEGGTWFTRFGDAFKKSWKDKGGSELWKWDVSEEESWLTKGIDKIKDRRAPDTPSPVEDLASRSEQGPLASEQVKTPQGDDPMGVGESLEKKGLFGKVRSGTEGLKDKDLFGVKGLGTVGDAYWATSTGINAMNMYNQFAPQDDQVYGGYGDFGIQASELLGPTTDLGGMYNISAPTWSYDYNQSFQQNQQNSRNVWNNAYGLPEGFDSASMPGWGFGYDQWFMQSMGFAPTR